MSKKIDPWKGVVKPELLADAMKKLKAGDKAQVSYIRGSLQVLERHPPNKYIVPLVRKCLERYK